MLPKMRPLRVRRRTRTGSLPVLKLASQTVSSSPRHGYSTPRVDSGAAWSMGLGSPHQRLGQPTFPRKSSFRVRPALLMTGLITSTGFSNGTYAITPSHTCYTFSPTSQTPTVSAANVTGINFTDIQQSATYTISGTISPAAGGNGATVILSGAAGATTVANVSGSYSFSGLANGTYTVTPSNTGYAYSPASNNVTINAANVAGVNFTATVQQAHSVALSWIASTSTVSGYNVYRSTVSGTQYAKVNSSLVGGLAYTDGTVLGGTLYYYVTTAVDASGNESANSNEVSANIP